MNQKKTNEIKNNNNYRKHKRNIPQIHKAELSDDEKK